MKRTYVSPLATEVNVMTEGIIAVSVQVHDKEVDTTVSGAQLGNTQRGEWGNLWSK